MLSDYSDRGEVVMDLSLGRTHSNISGLRDRFLGQAAIVTGGAGGIGMAVCDQISREGGEVVMVDASRGAVERALAVLASDRIRGVVVDVANVESCRVEIAQIERDAAVPISVLINGAGVEEHREGFLDMTELGWDSTMNVNLRGAAFFSQQVVRGMAARRAGVIVNVVSILGLDSGHFRHDNAAYSVSKAGLTALTKCMAVSLAGRGIRVNAVAPGITKTPLNARIVNDPEWMRRCSEAVPLARLAEPGDVADAICFLASRESQYITGQVISVDGGASLVSRLGWATASGGI